MNFPGYSPRFEEALVYAYRLHAGQERKGSGIPYISHLLAVTALVLEDGGDETQAIAALLHDAGEDQGGEAILAEIERRFGMRIADLVRALSDTLEQPKPPWRERKERYLEHLREAPAGVVQISLADKLHNARSILADYRAGGEAVWERFRGGREGSLWYYRALLDVFHHVSDSPMVDELERVVAELERMAGIRPGDS